MPRKRKRDRDGLFTRPDSPYWWASFTDGRGRATRRSTGVSTEQDPKGLKAQAVRVQWIDQAETEQAQGPPAGGHTFDELMLLYLGGPSREKRAGERDHYAAKQLYPRFTNRVLEEFGAADARSYINRRRGEGAAPGTINKEIGLFSAALNWARRELEWAVPNPFQSRRQKEPAGRNRWLSRGEAERLMAAAQAARRAPHLADFIRLGLNTGMRPGEMLGLEWARVDLQRNLITLEADQQKNGKLGSVPLNRAARAALVSRARWRAEHCPAGPWVFCDRKGRRIASIKRSFHATVERAGLEDVHPRDLRRTFGSWLVQAGVGIERVAELMRHSDIRITARVYAHLRPDEAVEILDQPRYRISRSDFTLLENDEEEGDEPAATG